MINNTLTSTKIKIKLSLKLINFRRRPPITIINVFLHTFETHSHLITHEEPNNHIVCTKIILLLPGTNFVSLSPTQTQTIIDKGISWSYQVVRVLEFSRPSLLFLVSRVYRRSIASEFREREGGREEKGGKRPTF